MRIAITDACIFIDLYDLDLLSRFFSLELEIHTSTDVLYELFDRQQELLIQYETNAKLTIHTLSEQDRVELRLGTFLKGLSENDRTVLFLAAKLKAIVLSSDKTVRKQANKQAIETHGMFWIFDQLVDSGLLDKKEASDKLQQLVNTNIIYQNNMELLKEMELRLQKWK
ncbi:hypothetical protein EON73_00900 [bacterium]|nr:MAG: hypothetical protein EON73_00900 [bacterium]